VMDVPVPDLVIYLQAPEDVLLKRIARRGLAYERRIDAAYLRRLSDAYSRLFLYYEAAPLLIVNAAHIDLVDNDEDYQALVEQVQAIPRGRHYFNPSVASI
jgi:deoxyguanosine kinase